MCLRDREEEDTMGGSLVRVGVLALLLTLLSGCGSTYKYVNVRSSIPGTQGLVKAIVEAHSENICKDADVEHRSADVYVENRQGRPALTQIPAVRVYASDRCIHTR